MQTAQHCLTNNACIQAFWDVISPLDVRQGNRSFQSAPVVVPLRGLAANLHPRAKALLKADQENFSAGVAEMVVSYQRNRNDLLGHLLLSREDLVGASKDEIVQRVVEVRMRKMSNARLFSRHCKLSLPTIMCFKLCQIEVTHFQLPGRAAFAVTRQ